MADEKPGEQVTIEMIDAAADVAGIHISPDKKEALLSKLNEQRRGYDAIRKLKLANDIPPAYRFDPVTAPRFAPPAESAPVRLPVATSGSLAVADSEIPKDLEKLAYATIGELGALILSRKVSVTGITQMFLARLKRYDVKLNFLVTLTEERALRQAKELDAELATGKYRGPLHEIPWGAKDLLAVNGYPTTWGAGGFQQQRFDGDATVVKRLDEAGAVLIAKLSLGALAMGDK